MSQPRLSSGLFNFMVSSGDGDPPPAGRAEEPPHPLGTSRHICRLFRTTVVSIAKCVSLFLLPCWNMNAPRRSLNTSSCSVPQRLIHIFRGNIIVGGTKGWF